MEKKDAVLGSFSNDIENQKKCEEFQQGTELSSEPLGLAVSLLSRPTVARQTGEIGHW
jgi:hypothetical protein